MENSWEIAEAILVNFINEKKNKQSLIIGSTHGGFFKSNFVTLSDLETEPIHMGGEHPCLLFNNSLVFLEEVFKIWELE